MMDTHVDFETAKLLKEKGFDKRTYREYALLKSDREIFDFRKGEAYNTDKKGDIVYGRLDTILYNFYDYDSYSAPTIAEVVMWVYEKHGIWISVYEYKDHGADVNDKYVFRCNWTGKTEFNSPREVYEAAIKNTLRNLI